MGGAPTSLHELWGFYTSHSLCMVYTWTICFLCLFGMCSTPILRRTHRPLYTSPPTLPQALILFLGIVHIMDSDGATRQQDCT